MRRVVGFVLVALGVAVLAIGAVSKPVLYDRLATVQLDQRSTSVSSGTDVDVLDVSKEQGVRVLSGTQVTSTRKVVGIPGLVKGHDGQAFWQTGVTTVVTGSAAAPKPSFEGVSFNRKTGLATNCCGDFQSAGTANQPDLTAPVEHEGLFFKFPFDVQRISYPFWDGELDRAEPIAYKGQDKIDGLTVYRFEQKLGPETIGEPTELPGSVFGSDQPSVTADRVYENTRTLWIEPNTGVIIKGREQQNTRFEAAGLTPVPVTVGTIGYSDKTVADNVDAWGTKGQLLKALRTTVPAGGVILGIVLIGVGALLLFRRGADDDAPPVPSREQVPAGA